MSEIKLIKGKKRKVITGKKGGKYYISKGKKVYFGGPSLSKQKTNYGPPRRMSQSSSSSEKTPSPKKKTPSPKKKTPSPKEKKSRRKQINLHPPRFQPGAWYISEGKAFPVSSPTMSSKDSKLQPFWPATRKRPGKDKKMVVISPVRLPPHSPNKRPRAPVHKMTYKNFLLSSGVPPRAIRHIYEYAADENASSIVPRTWLAPSLHGDDALRARPGPIYKIQFRPGSRTTPGVWNCTCGDHYYRNKNKDVPESKACKHVKCFLDGSAGITPDNIHLFTGKGITPYVRRLITEWQIADSQKEFELWRNNPRTYRRSIRYKDPGQLRYRLRGDPYLLDSTTRGVGKRGDASMKDNLTKAEWSIEGLVGGKEQTKHLLDDIEQLGSLLPIIP